MDEDYDACDLENWFLAMQSADGPVIIPSFHRPAAIRYDRQRYWRGRQSTTGHRAAPLRLDSARGSSAPRQADGHDPTTFPDLVPNATSGKITYDVDNDGDGQTDSVWVDLGYPARRDAQGQLYKPLFAFMVIGLNGRIPLNTAGNLAGGAPGSNGGDPRAAPGQLGQRGRPDLRASERVRASPTTPWRLHTPASGRALHPESEPTRQVDNSKHDDSARRPTDPASQPAGRHAAAAQKPVRIRRPTGQTNGDNNFVLMNVATAARPISCPTASPTSATWTAPSTRARPTRSLRLTPPVAGRWGEAQSVPGYPTIPNPNPPRSPTSTWSRSYLQQPGSGRVTRWTTSATIVNGIPRDAADDNYNSFDPYPPVRRLQPAGRGRRPRLPRSRRGLPAARRADAAVRDAGRHQRHRPRASV